jgi:hypothetical protein
MTCDLALEALLDAELSELDGRSGTELTVHLRNCSRCRRVAAQLLTDTRGLAMAMAPAPMRPVPRLTRTALVPVFAMATMIMLVVAVRPRPAAPVADRVIPAPIAPSVARVETTPVAPAPRSGVRRESRPMGRAFARAVPVAPVRLQSGPVATPGMDVVTQTVRVTTPSGTRATVMHTSDPKLVVVWLY